MLMGGLNLMNNFKYSTITRQGSNRIAEAILNGTKIRIIGLVGITSEQPKTTAVQAMAGLYCDPAKTASATEGTWRIPVEFVADKLAYYFQGDYIFVEFGFNSASFSATKIYHELAILCRPDAEGEENNLYTLLVFQPTLPLDINSTDLQRITTLSFKIYFPDPESVFTL